MYTQRFSQWDYDSICLRSLAIYCTVPYIYSPPSYLIVEITSVECNTWGLQKCVQSNRKLCPLLTMSQWNMSDMKITVVRQYACKWWWRMMIIQIVRYVSPQLMKDQGFSLDSRLQLWCSTIKHGIIYHRKGSDRQTCCLLCDVIVNVFSSGRTSVTTLPSSTLYKTHDKDICEVQVNEVDSLTHYYKCM